MAAKKYRERNPLKPAEPTQAAQCPIQTKGHKDFTGIGEEAISGEGGGWLLFQDGQFKKSGAATLSRRWTIEDAAYSFRMRAPHGIPRSPQESSILAAQMLDALEDMQGGHETFRRIADMLRDPKAYADNVTPDASSNDPMAAIVKAARFKGGVPTIQEVGAVLFSIPGGGGAGHLYTTAERADKVREMLKKFGFQWLPGKVQGEHLRKKSP